MFSTSSGWFLFAHSKHSIFYPSVKLPYLVDLVELLGNLRQALVALPALVRLRLHLRLVLLLRLIRLDLELLNVLNLLLQEDLLPDVIFVVAQSDPVEVVCQKCRIAACELLVFRFQLQRAEANLLLSVLAVEVE